VIRRISTRTGKLSRNSKDTLGESDENRRVALEIANLVVIVIETCRKICATLPEFRQIARVASSAVTDPKYYLLPAIGLGR
jgi:hypothetical protein